MIFTYDTPYDRWRIELHPATGMIPRWSHQKYMAFSNRWEEVSVEGNSYQEILENIDEYHICHDDANTSQTPFMELSANQMNPL